MLTSTTSPIRAQLQRHCVRHVDAAPFPPRLTSTSYISSLFSTCTTNNPQQHRSHSIISSSPKSGRIRPKLSSSSSSPVTTSNMASPNSNNVKNLLSKPASSTSEQGKLNNPHKDFKEVESSRPDWNTSSKYHYTKTQNPDWTFGSGATTDAHPPKDQQDQTTASSSSPSSPSPAPAHKSIDPYAPGRPAGLNYKLLISGITPRPIAFLSTVSADGKTQNLAPFSYFNLFNHDPPLFAVGFATPLSASSTRDSLRNLTETGECVINIISESFLEAANATSLDAPYGVSEFTISGLTAAHDTEVVRAPRVREAVFSVEGKLDFVKEYESRDPASPGKKTGTLALIEGVRFWVREDAVDENLSLVDPAVLRPVSRMGGITYGRTTEVVEIPRPSFEKNLGGMQGYEHLKMQNEGE